MIRKQKEKWSGVFVPVVTPFNDNGKINNEGFKNNLEYLLKIGVDGVIISGSCGESYVLTMEEKKHLFKLAVNLLGSHDIKIVAGTGTIKTEDVVKLNQCASELEMDGTMILPPYYALPSEKEIIAHYETISKSIDIPIMLYNNPGRTKINLTPDMVDKLASLDNVIAIKDSCEDLSQTIETLKKCKDRISVFIGRESLALPGLIMGADGYISMFALILGKEAVDLITFFENAQMNKAKAIQERICTLWQIVFKDTRTPYPNIKEAINLSGRSAGICRKPLLPLENDKKRELKETLQNWGFIK